MRTQPENANAALAGGGAAKDDAESNSGKQRYKITPSNAQALRIVAVLNKGRASQLRIGLSNWRGSHKVELRECTSVIPQIYFPTAAGVTLDASLLPELIDALHLAEAELVSRGVLNRRAVA